MHGFDFWEFIPKTEIPILATLHLPPQWYVHWIYTMQHRRFHLNCVSDSQRASVPSSAGFVHTIHNGVAIPAEQPLPMSKRNGAVMLGRICPEKGTDLAIRAARGAGIQLTIAGRPLSYPEHLRYFREQVLPNLDRTITYAGTIAGREKFALLRSAKCVLVPSLAPETSSLVAMEALACGTPVIAMCSGALPEIVEHGKTGFIVHTTQSMTDAILRIDEIDPMTCYRTAARRFSAERMSREYVELYERLIDADPVVPCGSGQTLVTSHDRRTS